MSDIKKLETFIFFAVQHDTPWVSNYCAVRHQFDVRQVGVLCKQTLNYTQSFTAELLPQEIHATIKTHSPNFLMHQFFKKYNEVYMITQAQLCTLKIILFLKL
jgi:hypothetical protein